MEKFRAILLDVWRDACRHIEIGASTATIAQTLRQHMPLVQLLVRRLDKEKAVLETVAAGLPKSRYGQTETRTSCSEKDLRALEAWCKRGVIAGSEGTGCPEGVRALLIPPMPPGDVMAGPIVCPGGTLGALVLAGQPGRYFEKRHEAMLEVLLEPFSIALENDHHLREMSALREAAEADKRSLLERLGRKELRNTIIGVEGGLKGVMERVGQVAHSDVPVLVFGESGTGKEVVARALHEGSSRSAGPFIRVNCGATPPELIDSELFGHEAGAFTGAVERRKGWFERADGGTLFLDEIGELTPAVQVRLLRILQDGWLERVGGQRPVEVSVRIIAATHRDLASMVAEHAFREDLWYRIAVFPIYLPPLRDRLGDIPDLARHFAEKAAVRFGLPALMPTERDMELLSAYSWPGNVRELGSVIDRAALLGNGTRLEVAQALGILPPGGRQGAEGASPGAERMLGGNEIQPLDDVIRSHIESALTATGGRIEGPRGAATLLDINPHTLRARMRKLEIEWKKFRG